MPERLTIRDFKVADLPYLIAMEEAAHGKEAWDEGDFRHYIGLPTSICLVAIHDKLPVGFVVYEIEPIQQRQRAGRLGIGLYNLVVATRYRRQGVGTLLLNRLKLHVDGGTAPRARRILHWVWETNLAGQLFLRANGFICNKIDTDKTWPEPGYRFVYKPAITKECKGK